MLWPGLDAADSARLPGRAVNEDRRRGSPDELIRHTSQQQPFEAALAVRGQGDEGARLPRGLLRNGLAGVTRDDDPRLGLQPLFAL